MSKIVNNPADRKAIIWDQSHLSKFQMFIPLALFCFFYFLILSCIKVQKTFFFTSSLLCSFEGMAGKIHDAIASHTTNKEYRRQIKISFEGNFRWRSQCTVFTGKCISGTLAMKQICRKKSFSATFMPSQQLCELISRLMKTMLSPAHRQIC